MTRTTETTFWLIEVKPPDRVRGGPLVPKVGPGVVHHDVDAAKCCQRCLGDVPGSLVCRQVAQGDGGTPAAVRDGLRHPHNFVFPAAMYDDGGTLLRQRLGGGLPDAAAAARYQRTLALKL